MVLRAMNGHSAAPVRALPGKAEAKTEPTQTTLSLRRAASRATHYPLAASESSWLTTLRPTNSKANKVTGIANVVTTGTAHAL